MLKVFDNIAVTVGPANVVVSLFYPVAVPTEGLPNRFSISAQCVPCHTEGIFAFWEFTLFQPPLAHLSVAVSVVQQLFLLGTWNRVASSFLTELLATSD
jgi:hypothetical protein